jgi:hypothetical protein
MRLRFVHGQRIIHNQKVPPGAPAESSDVRICPRCTQVEAGQETVSRTLCLIS